MRPKTMLLPVAAVALAAATTTKRSRGSPTRSTSPRRTRGCARHERHAGEAFGRIIGRGRPTAAEAQRFLFEAVVPALRSRVA